MNSLKYTLLRIDKFILHWLARQKTLNSFVKRIRYWSSGGRKPWWNDKHLFSFKLDAIGRVVYNFVRCMTSVLNKTSRFDDVFFLFYLSVKPFVLFQPATVEFIMEKRLNIHFAIGRIFSWFIQPFLGPSLSFLSRFSCIKLNISSYARILFIFFSLVCKIKSST